MEQNEKEPKATECGQDFAKQALPIDCHLYHQPFTGKCLTILSCSSFPNASHVPIVKLGLRCSVEDVGRVAQALSDLELCPVLRVFFRRAGLFRPEIDQISALEELQGRGIRGNLRMLLWPTPLWAGTGANSGSDCGPIHSR